MVQRHHKLLRRAYSYLAGNITVTEGLNAASFAYAPPTIAVANTLLVNAAASSFTDGNLAWSTHSELPSKMEGLLQNITLSILTGSLDATQTTSTTCIRMESIQRFEYDAHRLWLVYGLGLGAALLCDLVGIAALFRNAFGATDDFSDFLGATRNAELDTLDLKQPGRIRLRYGPVRSEGGRCAFARPENLYEDGGGAETDDAPFLPSQLYGDAGERSIAKGGAEKGAPFLPERLYDDGR